MDRVLCVCDARENRMWLITLEIAGEVVDSLLVDYTQSPGDLVKNKAMEHVRRAVAAENEGKTFKASIICPDCGGGQVFTPEGPQEILGELGSWSGN